MSDAQLERTNVKLKQIITEVHGIWRSVAFEGFFESVPGMMTMKKNKKECCLQ
jgi:hypothetical protein